VSEALKKRLELAHDEMNQDRVWVSSDVEMID
jgi:hypothetical protein